MNQTVELLDIEACAYYVQRNKDPTWTFQGIGSDKYITFLYVTFLKGNSRTKIAVVETKNFMDGFNNRLDIAKAKVTELELELEETVYSVALRKRWKI